MENRLSSCQGLARDLGVNVVVKGWHREPCRDGNALSRLQRFHKPTCGMKRQRAVHTDTRGRNGAAALWTAPVLFFAVALRCRTKRLRVKDASVSEHQLKGTRDLTTCFFFFFFFGNFL